MSWLCLGLALPWPLFLPLIVLFCGLDPGSLKSGPVSDDLGSRWSRLLLDGVDVDLHVSHVSVAPVVLEAHHQSVWLESTQTHRLKVEHKH